MTSRNQAARRRFRVRHVYVSAALMLAFTATLFFTWVSLADTSPQTIPFAQNWANTGLITTTNDWSGVPGIIGYRGDGLTGATAVDPQTVVADGSGTPVNVLANQTNPNTNTTGGVAEFDTLANPVVAFQGSGTARAPHLVITLNTTGVSSINVAYNLRDVDGSTDNAVQPVALQYRVGASGNYTNLAAGFVADASSGPSLATLVTPVSVTLPAACNNQPVVQVRIITTDAVGSDEWIGVDDISITGAGVDAAPTVSNTSPTNNASNIAADSDVTTTFSEPVDVTGSWYQISCSQSGTHTATVTGGPTIFTLNPDSDFSLGDVCTVTINHLLVTDQDTNDPPDTMAADYVFSFTVGPTLSIADVTQVETNGATTFTFNVSLSAPAPSNVTFNIATSDGTAQDGNPGGEDNDYVAKSETGRTITTGNSSAAFTVTVNGDATQEPNETFFVTVSNVVGAGVADGQAMGTIINDDGVGSSTVVISQVYGGGGNSGATYKNDFIELYNRGATPVDVTGWSVQFTGATAAFAATSSFDGSPLTTNLSGVIQPGHYFLIQEAAGANLSATPLPSPDQVGAIAMGGTAGKVALVSNTTVLSGNCPTPFASNNIVDFVGYAPTADCSETSPTAILSNTTAAIRKQNGCQDTDNNNIDFNVGGPIPRNSSNANSCSGGGALSASGSANPTSVDPGGSTLLTVTVSPATTPPSTGITVTGDLTSIGGSATQQFYDDGTHGDVTAGDNIFSFFYTIPTNSSTGAKSINVNVSDAQARTAPTTITMSVAAPTCGVERWSIKVGTDAEANQVNLNSATPITIADMRGWPAPSPTPPTSRVAPYEKTAWVINGTLINYKKEDDVDYHIVVKDGSGTNTVITEVPCPCCAIGSPFEPRIDGARTAFDSRLTAQTFFQNPNIPVRITGVGFFDFLHGQTGVAPNGIELHAILDIAFPTQQSATTGVGSNVTQTIGDATIRFTDVSNGGTTTVTPIDPALAGTPPGTGGYKVVGPAFDISTAATTTGPYNVCISVPYITDSVAFQHLKLLHNEGGNLIDRTTGQNFSSKLICGNSPSLSPFAVALASAPTAADSIITGQITTSTGAPVAGAVIQLNGMQNRKTITDANGNYRFDNVETNGFYTVTPSRANFSFSPGIRSFSQLSNKTEAAFTGSIMLQGANPLDTAEYFVRQHYLDFLGREPDESGFNFWSNEIVSCDDDFACVEQKRVNVSAAYFQSIEFQETGGLVDSLYRASFDRAPKYAEFTPDSISIAKDVVVGRGGWQQQLAGNKHSFLNAFVQRPDFQAVYGNLGDSQYVDQLLVHTRIIWTQAERNALVDGLTNGTLTRATVLGQIAGDQRFVAAKRNEMFVMMEYFGYLRRDPDADGYQFWLNKLNQFNGNFEQAEMVKAFIASSEYRERFPR
jgi:hypothetical protein